jgi:uncharacterized protein YbjQ (UPF0145 family)
MNTKPSEVKVSLSVSDWKKVVGYLKNFAAQPANSQWVQWAESMIENIKTSAPADINNQSEMSVILKPSVWKGMLTPLKPASKNDSKEHKEFVTRQIQTALNIARQSIVVTTGDIKQNYEIVGPVYFQVSNKGLFSNQVVQLSNEYRAEIAQMRSSGQIGELKTDWSFLYGEWTVGQSLFEQAFYVAVQEIKKRTMLLDADGIISMRQDIDLDTTGFQFFYLQMYGTAVRLLE